MAAEHGLASRPGVRGGSQHPVLHEPKNNGHDLSYGGSSMRISAECAGTIAEFDQNRRDWRTALQYGLTDHNSSINQLCCHLNYQLAECHANVPQPASLAAALMRNTDGGHPLLFSPHHGSFRCRTCFRRGVDSARYVADLANSHARREDHGV